MCDLPAVYKKTTRQLSLTENSLWLGGSARERLERTWAQGFRENVLPLLLEWEDKLSVLFSAVGRPNWSVARRLGCLLLQELEGKKDQAVLDSLSFDVRYQHALGMTGAEAYLSRRSLVDFRSRLVAYDPDMKLVRELFDEISAAMSESLNLKMTSQRIDSTQIISNIRVRGRLGLFRQTVRHFVMWLKKHHESEYEQLSRELRTWYQNFNDNWESPKELPGHKRLIQDLAGWSYEIVQQFASVSAIAEAEPYRLVERLIREQCIVTKLDSPGGDDGDESESGEQQESDRVEITVHETFCKKDGVMRTPHDPTATTGKKGVGYHVHVVETCNNAGPEVITDFEVTSSHVPDTGKAPDAINRLKERDRRPDVLYADGGYPTPQTLVESEDLGTQLHAPVNRQSMPKSKMSRMDFTIDESTGRVLSCPQGHAPALHTIRAATPTRKSSFALFDAELCGSCPQLKICPVQSAGKKRPNGKYRLEESRGLYMRDRIYKEQRSEEWRERYRIRAGAEGTMSELKRTHRLERLRVRGRPKVVMNVAFKLMACNIKRWAKYVSNTINMGPEYAEQAA